MANVLKKRSFLKNKIAGFVRPLEREHENLRERARNRRETFYRGRPRDKSELERASSPQHARELRRQEQDFGITTLV